MLNVNFVYGAGDGNRDAKEAKPLKFVSCTLESGGSIKGELDVTPKFKLQFDKNVVNMLVWENNRNCISLVGSDNKTIPSIVSKIDDTVDFDNRRNIFLTPKTPLEKGKIYYIKVSPNLVAANKESVLSATTGGKGVSLSFKTKGEEKVENESKVNNKIETNNKENKSVETTSKGNTVKSSSEDVIKETVKSDKENTLNNASEVKKEETLPEVKEDTNSNVKQNENKESVNLEDQKDITTEKSFKTNYILLGAVGIIICWLCIEYFIRRKRK